MSVTATAKRRRQQARNGYRHLAPKQRPGYKVTNAASAQKRLQAQVEKMRAMAARKGASKKK